LLSHENRSGGLSTSAQRRIVIAIVHAMSCWPHSDELWNRPVAIRRQLNRVESFITICCSEYCRQAFLTKYYMSHENKLDLPARIRDYRKAVRLSQDELGERLGVSGNYISMIELGKKAPGPSLRKLFEALEQSPVYQSPAMAARVTVPRLPKNYQSNPMLAMLSTDMLIKTLAEVADKLVQVDDSTRKQVLGNMREYLDEIEHRLLSGMAEPVEANRIPTAVAKSIALH